MFNKIKACLSHPSRIGAYYKDSILKNLSVILIFSAIFMILVGVKYSNADHFNNSHSAVLAERLTLRENSNIYFDSETDKLYRAEGEKFSVVGNEYRMNFFCETETNFQSSEVVINFKEDYVDVVLYGSKIGTLKYADYDIESFSLLKIKQGDYKAELAFEELMNLALDKANTEYTFVLLGDELFNLIQNIFITIIVCVILSLFINKGINLNVRIRLCIIDCFIYMVFLIFTALFNISWLQYVGLFLACYYTCSTFRHIIKVEKRRF